jgi:hypothetical protein
MVKLAQPTKNGRQILPEWRNGRRSGLKKETSGFERFGVSAKDYA